MSKRVRKDRRDETTAKAPALPAPAAVETDEARYRPIEWSLVRKILGLLAPYRKQYAAAISLGLVHVFLDMQGPRFIQTIIDYVTEYTRGAVPGADEASAIRHILGIIGLWSGVFIGSVILQRLTILLMTRAGESVQFDIRRRLFAHLQILSMSYYDKTKLGRIISRMTSDIGALREVNVWGMWQVVANGMMMLVAATLMAIYSDWRLLLSVAWLAPVLFVANRIFLTRAGVAHQVAREGWTRVSTNLAENITGIRVVTAFNRQEPNLGVFNQLQSDNTANNVHVARVNGLYQPILQTIGFLGKAIILLYGGYLVASGQLKSVGSVVLSFLYWDWFMNPVLAFGNFYNQLMMAMAGAERVFDLLETSPDVRDLPGAVPLGRIEGQVKFEDVTFGYHPERPVLHGINFEARPGQTIALVGSTGSGKSSIISLIARFYQPQQGRVLVDGRDIRQVTGESLNRQTGLVLQNNYLFSGTVMENIRYAKPEATEQQVIESARAIGSLDAILSLKDGFATEVGERGGSMSLGQRQLICFTRAFLADPRIFMLDEATSAVDTATELLVQRSLEKLLLHRTTFIVAHRLSTILKADCILVIDQGRIVERGTHRELLQRGGRYAQLYEQFVSLGA